MVVLLEDSGRPRIKNPSLLPHDLKHVDLADGHFSWTTPTASRETDVPQVPYTHFALIAIDGRGCVRYHASQSLERHCRYIFTSDVKERFIQATGGYGRPQKHHARMEVQPKKRRLELEQEVPDVAFETVDRVPLKIGEEEKVLDYYESAFRAFQQINCRQIAKAFIKIIEPRKQVKHPYNGGRGALGEKGDPEKTKPDWWPAGVIHREPDHLKKPERIRLLVHIIRNLSKFHNITTEKLEEAGRDVKRHIKPRERWDILEEIYSVRRMEESYERGEIDANAVVYVINRDSSNKGERDSECLSDSGQASTDILENRDPFVPATVPRYNELEESKSAAKYLPPSDFLPSPVEQINTPATTTDVWSFQQPQALQPWSLTPTTATDMHMHMPPQFGYVPLGAPPFQTGSLGHSHLLHTPHDQANVPVAHYK